MGVDFRVAEAVDFDVADLWRGAEEVFQAEPRVLGGQVTARNQHGRSSRHTQPPCEQELASSSPSLSGRVGVKRFQTAPSRRSDVGCHSQGPRFSSGSALGPSHDGIRRMRRTNLPTRPCRKTYGRHKELETDSPHPSSLRGHRSTGRRNSGFLLLCFYCAQLAVRFPVMWPQLLLWSNETRCHPPTCDA